MLFENKLVILGAKSSKGEYNGKPYDSTTIYYQASLQDGDNFAGDVGAEIKWGTSANFDRVKNLKFPFTANCKMEQVSNGKVMVTILRELTPDPQPK